MIIFKIILTVLWIIAVVFLIVWIVYEMVHATDDGNKILDNIRKMEQKDLMDKRDEKK
tara:strand:- start:1535 stop:1708 length:174 start_codon:yes stop_codon:yes gene_type:complete